MGEEQLVTLDEAMKELQIDREELKELFRKNSLRYILDNGRIKIPKMALMALKLEKMTSTTQQFTRIKRSRKKEITLTSSSLRKDMVSFKEALKILGVTEEVLKKWIKEKEIRYLEFNGEYKFPKTSLYALKILKGGIGVPPKIKKNKRIKRLY